jgi:hypothetical protein
LMAPGPSSPIPPSERGGAQTRAPTDPPLTASKTSEERTPTFSVDLTFGEAQADRLLHTVTQRSLPPPMSPEDSGSAGGVDASSPAFSASPQDAAPPPKPPRGGKQMLRKSASFEQSSLKFKKKPDTRSPPPPPLAPAGWSKLLWSNQAQRYYWRQSGTTIISYWQPGHTGQDGCTCVCFDWGGLQGEVDPGCPINFSASQSPRQQLGEQSADAGAPEQVPQRAYTLRNAPVPYNTKPLAARGKMVSF